jgi:hypothetical protein
MSSPILNVFTPADIEYLNALPEVLEAKARLTSQNVAYFSITLTESLRTTLEERLNLDLSTVSSIPLRWIKGDTPPHIDRGASAFEHTYLVYVNDSEGSFVLGSEAYPIQANTAFVFSEGISHKTEGTGLEPRLLVGPMNELAEPVGGPTIKYYANYSDAINDVNAIALNTANAILGQVTSGSIGAYNYWRVAVGGTGATGVYPNGFDLSVFSAGSTYFVYPGTPCFKEGTKVLCQVDGVETYQPIETLKVGTLVKTSHHGFKKVELIGSGSLHNPGSNERLEDRLYKCSPANYPELTEDLYITGNHSILVDSLTKEQREQLIKHMGQIFLTDTKCRLIACVDERAEPLESEGVFPIWHLALENENEKMNYGIYVNGGLLVETCSINTLKSRANLVVV